MVGRRREIMEVLTEGKTKADLTLQCNLSQLIKEFSQQFLENRMRMTAKSGNFSTCKFFFVGLLMDFITKLHGKLTLTVEKRKYSEYLKA